MTTIWRALALAIWGWLAAAVGGEPPARLDAVLAEARAAEARFDSRAALKAYEEAAVLAPEDATILQKVAQQLSDLTPELPDVESKRRYARRALEFAERARGLAPDDPVVALSVAICHGKLATYAELREKIGHSRLVREWAERAVRLDPDYDWAHHVLGRWHAEVAGLGRGARWFLKVVYGGLPDASLEQAVRHLESARRLAPERLPHQVELGAVYVEAGRRGEGLALLEGALTKSVTERHDEAAQRRARELLAKFASG